MNEAQFKSLVRFTFFLQAKADQVVLNTDDVLARTMHSIKEIVKSLPAEGLLRDQSWKGMESLVKFELDKYSKAFGDNLLRTLDAASGRMEDYALKEALDAGADLGTAPVRLDVNGTPAGTELALKANVGGQPIRKLFDLTSNTNTGGINRALFKTIDTRVRTGFLRGTPTQEIADMMMTDITVGGIPGVALNAPVTRQIRNQAMAVARTATQSMAREVKEAVYDANKEALEGLEWEWEATLDSRTCSTCMPLDQQRWPLGDTSRPEWPLHPNCRCQTVLVDPEDKDFAEQARTATVIRPMEKGPYQETKSDLTKAYKTPTKVKGQEFYRKTVTVTSDTPPPRYADVLAKWASDSKTSLVEAMGPQRAAYFKKQLDEFNRDPQQILEAMLKGRPGEQQWIPIARLKTLKVPAKPKAKPKAAANVVKPKPKPKVKAAVAKAEKKVATSNLTEQIAAKEKEFKKLNQELLMAEPKQMKAAAEKAKKAKAELEELKLKDPAYAAKQKAAEEAFKKELQKDAAEVELSPAMAKAKPPKAALKKYTGEAYREMRAEEFRAAKKAGKKLTPFEEAQIGIHKENKTLAKNAAEIESFLDRAPKYKGEVYRTMITDQKGLEDMLAGFKEGNQTLAMESWTSDSALDFAQGRGQRITLRTKNKKGVDISLLSEFERESEVLMPKGVKYKLKGVIKEEISARATKEGRYSWTIDLEQL